MSNHPRIGINGFGRIGRKIARLALERSDIELVAINTLSSSEQTAHLFKYDSVHGVLNAEVTVDGDSLWIKNSFGNRKIRLIHQKDPAQIPWRELEVDYVHECTGAFTERNKAALHLEGGAKKVIISAPSTDPDATLCLGVNEKTYIPDQHHVISNASCTTNCLAPLAKVLDENFGIVKGALLTVHSYTNDQQLMDSNHKDWRRGRAAALSQIPTTTGAAKAVGLVIPHLKGKLDGLSVRVPTANVSMVDLTVELKTPTERQAILDAFEKASQNELKGILAVNSLPLVSTDFNGRTESAIFDSSLVYLLDRNLAKIIAWYDNESGFSARMLDLTTYMANL